MLFGTALTLNIAPLLVAILAVVIIGILVGADVLGWPTLMRQLRKICELLFGEEREINND